MDDGKITTDELQSLGRGMFGGFGGRGHGVGFGHGFGQDGTHPDASPSPSAGSWRLTPPLARRTCGPPATAGHAAARIAFRLRRRGEGLTAPARAPASSASLMTHTTVSW